MGMSPIRIANAEEPNGSAGSTPQEVQAASAPQESEPESSAKTEAPNGDTSTPPPAPSSAQTPTNSEPKNVLRKISDEEWSQIAGEKTSQKFPVKEGNTLWGISKDLFGDPMYWPKIWALNNGTILNPHVIKPGQQVTFLGGSGSALPSIGIQGPASTDGQATPLSSDTKAPPEAGATSKIASAQETASAALQTSQTADHSASAAGPMSTGKPQAQAYIPEPSSLSDPERSREWMKLPLQTWEAPPAETVTAENLIHDQAKDQSGAPVRLRSWPDRGIQLEGLPESDRMSGIATIVGSRKEGLVLGKGDMVYIEADTELVEGETYGITSEDPLLMKTRKSDRSGWLHPYLGKVRVLAVKEGVYVGEILESAGPIQRDDLLIPLPAKVFAKQPIPAANPLEATLLLNKETSMYATSQFKQVIIDRGSGDGVYPGMVFRSYQYWDPGTGDRFTDSDFIIDADILVVHSNEDFSVGIVLSSMSPVTEGSTLVLLTDIGDVLDKNGYRLRTQDEVKRDEELKELDLLPPQNQLEDAERRELEQLEKWQKNPEGTEGLIEDPEKMKDMTEDTSQSVEAQGQEEGSGTENTASDEELVPPEQPEVEDSIPPSPENNEDPPPPPPELPPEETTTEGADTAASNEPPVPDSEANTESAPAGDSTEKSDGYPQDEPIQSE